MENNDASTLFKENVFNTLKNELMKDDTIIFAYLHGSFLEGNLYNDIDVALYLDENKIPREKQNEFCDTLGYQLSGLVRFVVDVRAMNHSPVGFQHSVFKHGELLFSVDDDLRTDLMEESSMEVMVFHELALESILDMVDDGN